jgi:hypothetical protein
MGKSNDDLGTSGEDYTADGRQQGALSVIATREKVKT